MGLTLTRRRHSAAQFPPSRAQRFPESSILAHPTGFEVASAFAGSALDERTMSALLALAIQTRHSADGPNAESARVFRGHFWALRDNPLKAGRNAGLFGLYIHQVDPSVA